MPADRATIPRRHDLDALRAIAMLLGIGLHGALSFMPMPEGGWPVQDCVRSESFQVFMSAVHGFRMPLFFLISGFFTAMLWRKRGLLALLKHRFKRIFVPLVIGVFTLVPVVWVVSIAAGIYSAGASNPSGETTIWMAAARGDTETVTEFIAAGTPPDRVDEVYGSTPMAIAATCGQEEIVQLLIDRGADVNAKNDDGSTAMHGAALFGRADIVRLLIEHGGDAGVINRKGQRAVDVAKTDWPTTQIIASVLKIPVDRSSVEAGRKEIIGLLSKPSAADAPVIAGTGQDAGQADPPTRQQRNEALEGLLLMLTFFPFFHHLWFLAFLCWLILAFAIYAAIAQRIHWKVPSLLVVSPVRYLWLIPLTMLPQASMGLLFPNFGPDTSAGLLPMPNVLFYYAIFFFFGALYFDCDDQAGRLGRRWAVTLPVALLVVFPVGMDLTMGTFGFGDKLFPSAWHRPISVVLQVIYAWLMTFGLMGLFRAWLSGESKTMRYISDSSYWLYLAHLPLIIVIQAMVCRWQAPAVVKFIVICVVTSVLLLISYQWFVRYTPIGTLLNGPRRRPQRTIQAHLAEPSPAEG